MKSFLPVNFDEKDIEINAKIEIGNISKLNITYRMDIKDGVVGEPYFNFPLYMSDSLFYKLLGRCTILQEAGYKNLKDYMRNNSGGCAQIFLKKNLDMSMELELFPRYDWIESRLRGNPIKTFKQRIGLFDREKRDLYKIIQKFLEENGTSMEEQMELVFSEERRKKELEAITNFQISPYYEYLASIKENMNVFVKEYEYEKTGNTEKITFPLTFYNPQRAIYLLDKTDIYSMLGYKTAADMIDGIPRPRYLIDVSYGESRTESIKRRQKDVENGNFHNEDLLKAYLTFCYENGKQTVCLEFIFDYNKLRLQNSIKLGEDEAKKVEEMVKSKYPFFAFGGHGMSLFDFIRQKEKTGKFPSIFDYDDDDDEPLDWFSRWLRGDKKDNEKKEEAKKEPTGSNPQKEENWFFESLL